MFNTYAHISSTQTNLFPKKLLKNGMKCITGQVNIYIFLKRGGEINTVYFKIWLNLMCNAS